MISKEAINKKPNKKVNKEDPQVLIDKCYLIKELMESTRINSNNKTATEWISTFSNEDCDKLKTILQTFIEKLKCS